MSFLLGDLKGCFGEEFADLLLRGVGVPPVPRLGDPCEDPGVIEWLGLGPACEEVVVSCRVVGRRWEGGGKSTWNGLV